MDKSEDGPVDLRVLRVSEGPDSPDDEKRFVAAVMGAVRARGAATRASDPLLGLRDLAIPWLAAASVVIAVLVWQGRQAAAERPPRTVAEALGVPPEFLNVAADNGQGER